jgi:hypothetical protein
MSENSLSESIESLSKISKTVFSTDTKNTSLNIKTKECFYISDFSGESNPDYVIVTNDKKIHIITNICNDYWEYFVIDLDTQTLSKNELNEIGQLNELFFTNYINSLVVSDFEVLTMIYEDGMWEPNYACSNWDPIEKKGICVDLIINEKNNNIFSLYKLTEYTYKLYSEKYAAVDEPLPTDKPIVMDVNIKCDQCNNLPKLLILNNNLLIITDRSIIIFDIGNNKLNQTHNIHYNQQIIDACINDTYFFILCDVIANTKSSIVYIFEIRNSLLPYQGNEIESRIFQHTQYIPSMIRACNDYLVLLDDNDNKICLINLF